MSGPLRLANSGVPWKQIAGMRDVLIHHDFGVKLETVWQVVIEHLPPVGQCVEKLLSASLAAYEMARNVSSYIARMCESRDLPLCDWRMNVLKS